MPIDASGLVSDAPVAFDLYEEIVIEEEFTEIFQEAAYNMFSSVSEDKGQKIVCSSLQAGMILRNHTYLKVYKFWRILPFLKTPTIKYLVIFFKKYFNFQGFYIGYIIIWRFLG